MDDRDVSLEMTKGDVELGPGFGSMPTKRGAGGVVGAGVMCTQRVSASAKQFLSVLK